MSDKKRIVNSEISVNINEYKRMESMLRIFSSDSYSKDDFLDYALEEAIKLTNSEMGYIYLYDEKKKVFTLNSWSRHVMKACSVMEQQTLYELDKTGFWGEVVRQRCSIINNEFSMPHPLKKGVPKGHAPLHKYMSLPIFEEESIVAVIGLANKKSDYTDMDLVQIDSLMSEVWSVYKRRQAELSASDEKEYLLTLIESIADGIISFSTDFRVTHINRIAIDYLGLNKEDVVERDIFEVSKGCHKGLYRFLESNFKTDIALPLDTSLSSISKPRFETIKLLSQQEVYIRLNLSVVRKRMRGAIGYVLIMSDVTDEILYQKKVEYLSYRDELTHLYNRRFFEEELKRYDDDRHLPLSIIMGDVNGLKLTNDAFGHLVGDKLLKAVATILKSSCRKSDVVSRWAGDEFAIILPKTDIKRAEEICSLIEEKCSNYKDLMIDVSISLGFATKNNTKMNILRTLMLAEESLYKKKLLESNSQKNKLIHTIRKVIHEKSHETFEHTARLNKLIAYIGDSLRLDSKSKHDMELLIKFHDIGIITIPDTVLNKKVPLTEKEWNIIKKHPAIGYRIANACTDLSSISEYILYHHERWDGTGYPDQKKGKDIPLFSRVIAIIDAFDAMTNDRPYRKALSKDIALEELKKNSGKQFDPDLVELFITNYMIKCNEYI